LGRVHHLATGRFRVARFQGPLSGDEPGKRSDWSRPFSDNRIAEFDVRKRSLGSRANRATTAGCLTPTGYIAYHQPGPRGLPMALRLSEYEGTSHNPSTASSAKIEFSKSI
jgi:hypothetical protein